jgi:hypothetical protein
MIKRKILVVEDERLIARDIALQLCILGHEPLGPKHTGEQGIEAAFKDGWPSSRAYIGLPQSGPSRRSACSLKQSTGLLAGFI